MSNLNDITDLPRKTIVLTASAVNGCGDIAALAQEDGTNRVALLTPRSSPCD